MDWLSEDCEKNNSLAAAEGMEIHSKAASSVRRTRCDRFHALRLAPQSAGFAARRLLFTSAYIACDGRTLDETGVLEIALSGVAAKVELRPKMNHERLSLTDGQEIRRRYVPTTDQPANHQTDLVWVSNYVMPSSSVASRKGAREIE